MQRTVLAVLAVIPACVLLPACSEDKQDDVTFALELEPGDEETVLVSTHCGFATLEIDVNGVAWSTDGLPADAAGNPTEPAWPNHDERVRLRLTLVDDDTLEVTHPGSNVSHTYRPDPEPPGCM